MATLHRAVAHSVFLCVIFGWWAASPVLAIPGDLDCSNGVNSNDIPVFVLALIDPAAYQSLYPDCNIRNADLNADGAEDALDIHLFVKAIIDGASPPVATELAGNALTSYPYFEYVRAFNVNAPVQAAIDPTRFPSIVGKPCDVYVVAAKTDAQWQADPSLTDVTPGGALTTTFNGTTIQGNTVTVATANQLNADAGTGLGVGYDLIIDVNRNGILDSGDYIDGLGSEAGFYMVSDTTAAGPLAVTEIIYSGGSWLGQDTYYPTNIATMGQLPLIVISHGNGHNYQWYDHIGYHLASYGCVVMSHENNTGPGIETASTTTLTNTDYIIGNQRTIGGGVLNGHIDSHRIVWIGHSRGAEGITRAYDRIIDGTYVPQYFKAGDILLLSSMLPTDFLKTASSNPHAANYHLWTASADDDVNGGADCDLCQTFHLHDRATRFRHSTVVQGAGHGDFHDGGGSSVASGPCLIGRDATHLIQKGYFLPLVKHYVEGNIPAMDFFWRQWERFRPIGAPIGTCIVVTNTYHNGAETGNFVIDDYQTQTSANVSSSGGAITYTVQNLTEGRLDDNNSDFTWSTTDPMNGMTNASSESSDDSRGVVFDWNGVNKYYEFAIVPAARDFTNYRALSYRACQGTQHPYTKAVLGDLTFTVTLRDVNGVTSSINIGAYGGGVEEPYQRSNGWHNEFETTRIRLTDFLANGSSIDLTNIAAVRFNFGPSYGSSQGRLGLDDVELTSDAMPNVFVAIGIAGGAPLLLAPGVPTTLDVSIVAMGEEIVPGSELLHYRFEGNEYQTTPLTPVSAGRYQATIPAANCGESPQFYISARGTITGLVTDPAAAPSTVYKPDVGVFTAFYNNPLDTNPGWTTEGLWALGHPTGQGGQYGCHDPSNGYTGTNVYGYNLNGDYENNLPERKLTSTAISCAGRTHVRLSFWRWLGVEQPSYDHARLYISNNGTTWNVLWQNDATIADGAWVYQEFDISAYADNQPSVYLRWTMGTTDTAWQYCGWNIDDIRLLSFECD